MDLLNSLVKVRQCCWNGSMPIFIVALLSSLLFSYLALILGEFKKFALSPYQPSLGYYPIYRSLKIDLEGRGELYVLV
jgi:hypothetical protein